MKKLFLPLFLITCVAASAQQAITISGKIVDETTREGIPFATITLTANDHPEMITGSITDGEGQFILSLAQRGDFIVNCSYLGYQPMAIPLLVGQKNDRYDLGKILFKAVAEQLEAVTVSAQRAIVEAGLDKKSFALQDQIAQSGGSVLDAMKALPGITVDQEGRVLLRGSDQVAILLDGQQSGMTGFGSQQGLDNIPAANIERIEIINNPSAKYDANGMAGIINIIYRKDQEQGFNGEVGFAYGLGELTTRREDLPTDLGRYHRNPKYIPSTSLNYRTPKTNTFLQAEVLQQRRLPNNEFTTRNYREGRRTISAVPENRTQTHYIVKGGVDYFLNERNTLNFSAIWDYESHIDTAQIPYIDLNTNERYRYWHWKEEEVTGYLNFRLNYKHAFAQPGHELNVAAQYVRGWEDEAYFLNDSSTVRQSTDATHLVATEHTTSLTADYVKPLRHGRLELGSKLQFRTIPVTYEVTRGDRSVIYEGLGEWSDWGENIYALYLNYILETRHFELEGGLRTEQTDVYYDLDPANRFYPENDAYDYFRVYPNIRLTFKLDPANNLSVFFNNRVDRPGEPNLRIFPKFDDPELLKVGNPYVRPQFTQTFEAAYKRIWSTGSAFFAAYYRQIEDPFLRIFNIDNSDADYNIINKIYQNVAGGSNLGFEFLLSQKIRDFWSLSASLNWYDNRIDAFDGNLLFPFQRTFRIAESSERTWDLKLSNQVDLPGNIRVQLTGLYLAPKNIPQGRQLSRSSIDLGVQKRIWQQKGEVTFSFTDILNDYGIRQEITESDFTALYENYYETQIVRLGLKYKW